MEVGNTSIENMRECIMTLKMLLNNQDMTIKDLIEQFKLHNSFDGDTLYLGYRNGWDTKQWYELDNIFRYYRVPDTTKSRTLGNCETLS